jgi:hypothetical protein
MKGDERARKRCNRNQKEMLEMLNPGTPFIHLCKDDYLRRRSQINLTSLVLKVCAFRLLLWLTEKKSLVNLNMPTTLPLLDFDYQKDFQIPTKYKKATR